MAARLDRGFGGRDSQPGSPGPERILDAGDRINLLAPRPLQAAAARGTHAVQDPGAPPDEAPGSANLTDL
jgi:hypothetical protein